MSLRSTASRFPKPKTDTTPGPGEYYKETQLKGGTRLGRKAKETAPEPNSRPGYALFDYDFGSGVGVKGRFSSKTEQGPGYYYLNRPLRDGVSLKGRRWGQPSGLAGHYGSKQSGRSRRSQPAGGSDQDAPDFQVLGLRRRFRRPIEADRFLANEHGWAVSLIQLTTESLRTVTQRLQTRQMKFKEIYSRAAKVGARTKLTGQAATPEVERALSSLAQFYEVASLPGSVPRPPGVQRRRSIRPTEARRSIFLASSAGLAKSQEARSQVTYTAQRKKKRFGTWKKPADGLASSMAGARPTATTAAKPSAAGNTSPSGGGDDELSELPAGDVVDPQEAADDVDEDVAGAADGDDAASTGSESTRSTTRATPADPKEEPSMPIYEACDVLVDDFNLHLAASSAAAGALGVASGVMGAEMLKRDFEIAIFLLEHFDQSMSLESEDYTETLDDLKDLQRLFLDYLAVQRECVTTVTATQRAIAERKQQQRSGSVVSEVSSRKSSIAGDDAPPFVAATASPSTLSRPLATLDPTRSALMDPHAVLAVLQQALEEGNQDVATYLVLAVGTRLVVPDGVATELWRRIPIEFWTAEHFMYWLESLDLPCLAGFLEPIRGRELTGSEFMQLDVPGLTTRLGVTDEIALELVLARRHLLRQIAGVGLLNEVEEELALTTSTEVGTSTTSDSDLASGEVPPAAADGSDEGAPPAPTPLAPEPDMEPRALIDSDTQTEPEPEPEPETPVPTDSQQTQTPAEWMLPAPSSPKQRTNFARRAQTLRGLPITSPDSRKVFVSDRASMAGPEPRYRQKTKARRAAERRRSKSSGGGLDLAAIHRAGRTSLGSTGSLLAKTRNTESTGHRDPRDPLFWQPVNSASEPWRLDSTPPPRGSGKAVPRPRLGGN